VAARRRGAQEQPRPAVSSAFEEAGNHRSVVGCQAEGGWEAVENILYGLYSVCGYIRTQYVRPRVLVTPTGEPWAGIGTGIHNSSEAPRLWDPILPAGCV
jgi:hypothetical protein